MRCARARSKLNVQLKDNIAQFNREIADREKAEAEPQEHYLNKAAEIKEREDAQIQQNSNPLSALLSGRLAGFGFLS